MAKINLRNESDLFIRQNGGLIVMKPSTEIESVTHEFFDVVNNTIFNVYNNENCDTLLGSFTLSFNTNDGVYISLDNIPSVILEGDINYTGNIQVEPTQQGKLVDWNLWENTSVINLSLKK